MVGVRFSFELTGSGWGVARLADDQTSLALPASYLSDVLGDLLEAIGTLLEGGDAAECSWDQEPGEYRWIFARDAANVHLKIVAFDDWLPRQPVETGTIVFATSGRLADVSRASADGIAQVLDEYGEEEYERRWVAHPFPSATLAMVRERLGAS